MQTGYSHSTVPNPTDDNNFWKKVVMYLLRGKKTIRTEIKQCETLFLTLTKERGLKVFDNRVPRELLEPKRKDVKGDRRKLANNEFHDLHTS